MSKVKLPRPTSRRGSARRSARASGRRAQSAGDAAEAFWEGQHQMALLLKVLVHVQHNQPAVRRVGGRLVYAAKSAADFTGTLADGRTFAAESKSVSGRRLARSAIRPLQAAQLDAVARAGGAAYLLVEFRDAVGTRKPVAIPWLEVPWKRLRSAESVGLENVQFKWWVVPGQCYLAPGIAVVVGGRRYPRE